MPGNSHRRTLTLYRSQNTQPVPFSASAIHRGKMLFWDFTEIDGHPSLGQIHLLGPCSEILEYENGTSTTEQANWSTDIRTNNEQAVNSLTWERSDQGLADHAMDPSLHYRHALEAGQKFDSLRSHSNHVI
ncbi:uncharacterized protein MYCGRDRAFT_90530 [Zymoseptoria tritici IPO323]|uniref:Uncharacterized protein n=1 Tax=Zymoseptoria tritici (strain CBS 115943 / IPO323) TaxID=336722 RepID=F9X258_ZYMTI|nr:uncharacterized protein MYCGRDRAFT_90530 [Zymoseptoria tritici IPO323]EGP90676.1 hypothetical protein MYCGRDRAFT_90530 [Zymoseptoria tritici IPO323]